MPTPRAAVDTTLTHDDMEAAVTALASVLYEGDQAAISDQTRDVYRRGLAATLREVFPAITLPDGL